MPQGVPPMGGEGVDIEKILAALSPEERAAVEADPSLLEQVLMGLAS
jgi:hypothetical protein